MQQFPTFAARHREAAEVRRLARKANKNVATQNGQYCTISTVQSWYYYNKLHESLKLLYVI